MSHTYDFVVFGATSFVGRILITHMAENLEEGQWAIAGRSRDKLEAQANRLTGSTPGIIIADANDRSALDTMCQQARVVISTAGPYAQIGEPLIASAVATGTDYCDITGEAHWVLQMMARYQSDAMASGARIVHCCGFDSIPSDLGVLHLQNKAIARDGRPMERVHMRVSRMRGGFSGGTYASLFNAVKDLKSNTGLRKAVATPYCLCPEGHPYHVRQTRHKSAAFDQVSDAWIAPFVMEGINTRIVHRSNALLDNRYGTEFYYDEAVVTGAGRKGRKRATRTDWGLKLLMISAAVAPLAALVQKLFIPKSGEGPSPEEQEAGYFRLTFTGKGPGREPIESTVSADRDPGYGATAPMLMEAAFCLADTPRDREGGFFTPAALMGERLIERLNTRGALHFDQI